MSTIVDKKDFLVSNLKGLLQEKLWLLEQRLQEKRNLTPYQELTDAQSRILATLRGESLTISEIARRLNVSRQAVHKLISQLIDKGLLALEAIPDNSRDKQVVFTPEGEALKKAAFKALQELEQEVEEALGAKNFALLKSLLKKEW
ncbi:MarR family transcriptional regulator [Candidatus Berkiella aquae]|uniref:HTH-type transcriptional regulator TcaR n=1 Tax=Candidatus Berkiella aquae TaxID=295108 RepID=A0A0Q9YL06_9GAMM|nr:helix-turn-helix domain-containing protein [Candidatus Berkiella aquae]MCS5710949.1 MarR family transcriptional regulator [Candidatus Berkiella aquae]